MVSMEDILRNMSDTPLYESIQFSTPFRLLNLSNEWMDEE